MLLYLIINNKKFSCNVHEHKLRRSFKKIYIFGIKRDNNINDIYREVYCDVVYHYYIIISPSRVPHTHSYTLAHSRTHCPSSFEFLWNCSFQVEPRGRLGHTVWNAHRSLAGQVPELSECFPTNRRPPGFLQSKPPLVLYTL